VSQGSFTGLQLVAATDVPIATNVNKMSLRIGQRLGLLKDFGCPS
jgi:hypothetical protein